MIERFVDYMQFTGNIKEMVCIEQNFDSVPPIKFYNRGYRHPFGYRIYYSNNSKNKQSLVVAAGQAMENMRMSGLLDAEILQYALSLGAKFSRIDLAVTEWNTMSGFVTMADIISWYEKGLCESSLVVGGAKLISAIYTEQERVPETFYVGDMEKRAKRGIFRAYDKGIELNLGEYMATRIELEEKREKAHTTALRVADTNDISGNFRARFNVRHNDFDRLMDADAIKTQRGAGKAKNQEKEEELDKRWAWLMSQVAPALKKAIDDDVASGKGYDRLGLFLQKSGVKRKALRWD